MKENSQKTPPPGQCFDLEDAGELELSPAELAIYETGLRDLWAFAPELFANFQADALDPDAFPTDRVILELVRQRDAGEFQESRSATEPSSS